MLPIDSLIDVVSSSPWTYAAVFAVAALDVLFPVVPSEATVISAGVVAAVGDLSLALVVLAGAGGAYTGDSTAYALGRGLGGRYEHRLFRSPRAAARRDWAERMLARHGGPIILGARFVPGGRTAATVTAGLVRMRWLRFAAFAAAAGLTWASYAALVGYLGGSAFEERPVLGLAFGFGIAALVFLAVEGVRRYVRRTPSVTEPR